MTDTLELADAIEKLAEAAKKEFTKEAAEQAANQEKAPEAPQTTEPQAL